MAIAHATIGGVGKRDWCGCLLEEKSGKINYTQTQVEERSDFVLPRPLQTRPDDAGRSAPLLLFAVRPCNILPVEDFDVIQATATAGPWGASSFLSP